MGVSVNLDVEGRRRRARVAANARHHPNESERTAADQQALKADAAARYVRELVDAFPPLTSEQRSRLAVLLLDANREGGGDAP